MMKINKILGKSIAVLCLGATISGFSAMAMLNNGSLNDNNIESIPFLSDSEKKTMKDIIYNRMKAGDDYGRALYYAQIKVTFGLNDIDTNQFLEIYKKEVKNGQAYASLYAKLIVVDKVGTDRARRQVKIFKDMLEAGKIECYSRKYAWLIVMDGLSSEEADLRANLYKAIVLSSDVSKRDREIDLVLDRVLNTVNSPVLALSKEDKKLMVDIFIQELTSKKDYDYAIHYAQLRVKSKLSESEAREYKKVYDDAEKERNSSEEANFYTKLIVKDKLDETRAKEQLRIFKKIKATGRLSGASERYARAIVMNRLSELEAGLIATLYEDLKFSNLFKTDFEIDQIVDRFSNAMTLLNLNDENKRRFFEIFIKEFMSTKNCGYAIYYAQLRVRSGLDEPEARRLAESYNR